MLHLKFKKSRYQLKYGFQWLCYVCGRLFVNMCMCVILFVYVRMYIISSMTVSYCPLMFSGSCCDFMIARIFCRIHHRSSGHISPLTCSQPAYSLNLASALLLARRCNILEYSIFCWYSFYYYYYYYWDYYCILLCLGKILLGFVGLFVIVAVVVLCWDLFLFGFSAAIWCSLDSPAMIGSAAYF